MSELKYDVYSIIYRSPSYGLAAVAVSGSSKHAAIKRLTGHRPAEVVHAEIIQGRQPEWEQDRIEGTVDLISPLSPPPQADTQRADEIRASNREIIHKMFPTARRNANSNY